MAEEIFGQQLVKIPAESDTGKPPTTMTRNNQLSGKNRMRKYYTTKISKCSKETVNFPALEAKQNGEV